jgi:hypothetical protein
VRVLGVIAGALQSQIELPEKSLTATIRFSLPSHLDLVRERAVRLISH